MLSFELKDKILQYADSKITLQDLEDWLVPRLPIFLKKPQTADADIVAVVELGLAEITNKIRTETEFRLILREVLQEHTSFLVYPFSISQTESTATNKTVHHSFSKTQSFFVMSNC